MPQTLGRVQTLASCCMSWRCSRVMTAATSFNQAWCAPALLPLPPPYCLPCRTGLLDYDLDMLPSPDSR